ncbi:MAG: hypothetical protein LBI91_03720, partial [Spirochaetaceae bacterium]|nr:hypothetical protein [Spirochaetaceae bacterium]
MNGNTARASLMRINAQRDNALYYQAEAALKQRGRDADSGTVFPVVIFILFVGGLVALFRYGGPLNRKA